MMLHGLWVLAMILYIGTAIYVELFCEAKFKRKLSGLFMAIGSAIFVSLNRRLFILGDMPLFWTELLILFLLIMGWYLGVRVIRHEQLRAAIAIAAIREAEEH